MHFNIFGKYPLPICTILWAFIGWHNYANLLQPLTVSCQTCL